MGEKSIKVRYCDGCRTDMEPISAHTLGWERKRWTLDLCPRCHADIESLLYSLPGVEPRRERPRGPRPAPYKAAEGVDLAEVREWAQANGIPVAKRGRVSGHVIAAWKESHHSSTNESGGQESDSSVSPSTPRLTT
jgi:hypothetical protein